MRLKDSFFTVESCTENADSLKYDIRLNGEHIIFKGHFPGNPIVPGVCQIQMITEILEEHLKTSLFLRKVANIKFTAILKPDETEKFSVTFKKISKDDDKLTVSATLHDETRQFSKTRLVYGYERV